MAPKTADALLNTLRTRFDANRVRHPTITWDEVLTRLQADPSAFKALGAMESSGGEPDVVVLDPLATSLTFVDCAAESPAGRRSLCYDREALDARKENKPAGSAVEMAATIGAELLTEAEYRALQRIGEFDLKTSSWVRTPDAIRALGGSLFCDRRYDTVFVYHNGAQSYYAARGFRCVLRV